MTKIKICGISDEKTLKEVCALGADYVGFVHHPSSPRHADLPLLQKLIKATKHQTYNVVVCVNPQDDFLDALCTTSPPNYIQLHGNEKPERVLEIKNKYSVKIIKSIAVREAFDIVQAGQYQQIVDAILFDAKAESGESGGLGISFDWSLLGGYNPEKLWFLSGGLSAENVAEALRATHAPAVDVSSHVETPSKSGVKDLQKIRGFMQAAKTA